MDLKISFNEDSNDIKYCIGLLGFDNAASKLINLTKFQVNFNSIVRFIAILQKFRTSLVSFDSFTHVESNDTKFNTIFSEMEKKRANRQKLY